MKRIIDGKRYDTETAIKLADYWNGLSRSDFHFIDEALYRTKKGRYFLAGEGGAMTKYAKSCGQNSWCGGSNITPLTESEVREWVESHANDKYEEIFGECEEA